MLPRPRLLFSLRLSHTLNSAADATNQTEGHEPSVLQSLVANRGHLPRQLAIEMHMRDAVGAVAPADTVQMAVLFYHLAALGYGALRTGHSGAVAGGVRAGPGFLGGLCLIMVEHRLVF